MDAKTKLRAGRIYALVAAYHACQGADVKDPEVAQAGAAWADGELEKMGLDPNQLSTFDACVAAAKGS